MAKKPSLNDALQRASNPLVKSIEVLPIDKSEPKQITQPNRRGKKVVAGHFDPAVSRLLKQIALDEETTVQDLLREAINDLFLKKGKPSIA